MGTAKIHFSDKHSFVSKMKTKNNLVNPADQPKDNPVGHPKKNPVGRPKKNPIVRPKKNPVGRPKKNPMSGK